MSMLAIGTCSTDRGRTAFCRLAMDLSDSLSLRKGKPKQGLALYLNNGVKLAFSYIHYSKHTFPAFATVLYSCYDKSRLAPGENRIAISVSQSSDSVVEAVVVKSFGKLFEEADPQR